MFYSLVFSSVWETQIEAWYWTGFVFSSRAGLLITGFLLN
jgi:hypothetical protein